jgi:hypothetical protein
MQVIRRVSLAVVKRKAACSLVAEKAKFQDAFGHLSNVQVAKQKQKEQIDGELPGRKRELQSIRRSSERVTCLVKEVGRGKSSEKSFSVDPESDFQ